MVDLLGPADAGSINTLTTTSDVAAPVAGDTWYQDCTGGVANTGTPEVAKYSNRLLQQVRAALRASHVPLSNSYDNMLSWAMQSGYTNWFATVGGTANALTGNADNAPIAITAGTRIFGIANANNTGATTFNWSGLGVDPVYDLTGTPLVGGEIVNGNLFGLCRVASHWRLITPMPVSWLLPQLAKIDIQQFDTSGTWYKPANFPASARVLIELWGAGAGGDTDIGGSGGAYIRFETYLNLLGSAVAVQIGVDPGGLGSIGGDSIFQAWGSALLAPGGRSSNSSGHIYKGDSTTGGANSYSDIFPAGRSGYSDSYGVVGIPIAQVSAIWGGGGGADNVPGSILYHASSGGTSVFGGAGGGYPGGAGAVPGGGGGAGGGGSGGLGGHGRCIVTTLAG